MKMKSDSKGKGRQPSKEEKPATMRLNKFIANAGVCSRREADTLIQAGEVKVNGVVVTEMGFQVGPKDEVKFKGKILKSQKFVYVLLNKPKGFVTTTKDPHATRTVMQLVEKSTPERIYPVGRLDKETTGLLLFTNDGDLTLKLTHPSSNVAKIYQVQLDKPISKADQLQLVNGIELEDGKMHMDELQILDDTKRELGVEIHSGRNRIIRRMFEHLGYNVRKLDRVTFSILTKRDLPRGKWRHLSDKEVTQLKQIKKPSIHSQQ